jgi:hypothetical protein
LLNSYVVVKYNTFANGDLFDQSVGAGQVITDVGLAAIPYWRAAKLGLASEGAIQYGTKGDLFLANAAKAKQPAGMLDVAVHGSPTMVEIGNYSVNHRVLANLIKRNPQFNGQPIRLLSCNTGELSNGFAKNLANKLGVSVTAPDNLIWAWPNGRLGVYPMGSNGGPLLSSQGKMIPFTPGIR